MTPDAWKTHAASLWPCQPGMARTAWPPADCVLAPPQVALMYRMGLKAVSGPVIHKFIDELEVEVRPFPAPAASDLHAHSA